MFFVAPGSKWTKAEHIVRADRLLHVRHGTVHGAELAEAIVEVGTILLSPITLRGLVPVDALLALQTVSLLLEIAAHGDLLLLVDVKILTVLAALALTLEPVNANYLLVLGLICLQIVRLIDRDQLVETHYIHPGAFIPNRPPSV